MHEQIEAGVLNVAYLESGDPSGVPVVLSHGFPYDVHAYAEVAPILAAAGCRVLVPYLRGYGPTRFLSDDTPRSGEQAVLGRDLLDFLDALTIGKAVVAGYDWGGRAACIVAAMWPERVIGLATVNGYNIQDIASSGRPESPAAEHRYWYQYYLHSERGRVGLATNRYAFCRLLWELWSPHWDFDDATFDRSKPSFNNPDFVDVVVHSYRHRYALVDSDPRVLDLETKLAARPPIAVPTIGIDGQGDGVRPPGASDQSRGHFTGPYDVRLIPKVGHNLPQEAPRTFAAAVLDLVHQRVK